MKKIIIPVLFLILTTIVYAAGDFPGVFIADGKFNGIIVVGNNGSASDVIAQSDLVQYFIGYTGTTLKGSAKLSGEVTDLSQNIISIGNPCMNSVSSEILNQPQPCDKNINPNKPLVMLFRKNGFYQMAIAGYTDKETRQAVINLINGNVNVQVESAIEKPAEPKIVELPKVIKIEGKNPVNGIKPEDDGRKTETADELGKTMSGKNIEENKKQSEISQAKGEPAQAKEEPKKRNVFEKIISWFKLFFGK